MNASQEMQTIINALPEPILILAPERGRIVAYNKALGVVWGITREVLDGNRLLRLPQFSRTIRRGLIGLYARARRARRDIPPFVFQYPDEGGTLRTVSATATPLDKLNQKERGWHVMLCFHTLPQLDAPAVKDQGDADAFSVFSEITNDPWLEFRTSAPIAAIALDDQDRRELLERIGQGLRLYRASRAAVDFYGLAEGDPRALGAAGKSKLKEKDFPSFFFRKEDAYRMLDILTTIGFVKTGTSMLDARGRVVEAEASCMVQFNDEGSIVALYCIFHFSEDVIRYKDLLQENQQEKDFTFNQPFVGLGQLVPRHPLDRPDAERVDEEIERFLDIIFVMTANEALLSLYGVPRNQFLMQPISALFPDRDSAAWILKELFVMRESSFASYDQEGKLKRVTLFRAAFNNSDQLTRIFVVSSGHAHGFTEHYNNLPQASA